MGATLGWSAAAAAEAADDGAGYGGNANALQVQVQGEQVRVAGVGFQAGSDVQVRIGDLSSTVTADEVGRVDALLAASAAGAPVAATGIAPNGVPTTRSAVPARGGSHQTGTLIGATLGLAPALMMSRKYGLRQ